MRTLLTAAAVLACAAPALAQTAPGSSTPQTGSARSSSAADARLRTVRFDPAQVTTLRGRVGVQSMITFRSDERIENVAVGDSATWQVTPNRRADALFVKPMEANARTNLTVITTRRTYLFDLVADRRGEPTYALSFTYAEPPIVDAEPETALAAAPAAPELAAAGAPAAAPLALNFAWRTEGAARLLPQQVFDDGHATYLRWAPGSPMPAILRPSAGGGEEPVNYAVVNDYVTVDGTPGALVLRSGQERAVLTRGAAARPLQTAER